MKNTEKDILSEKVETLAQKLDETLKKLEVLYTEQTAEEIETLTEDTKKLSEKVTGIEGQWKLVGTIFSLASLFIVIAGLVIGLIGGYNIYQYRTFVATREGTDQLLISQVEQKTADVFNKFNITKSSRREIDEVKNLQELINILEKLDIKDKHFQGIKALHSILTEIVLNEEMNEARKLTDQAIDKSSKDDFFVQSRLKTLKVVIPISGARNEISDEEEERILIDAIKLDNTNALAYNNLGIILANRARKIIINEENKEIEVDDEKFNEVNNLIKKANLNFEIASLLNPASTGKLKFINNKTWGNLILLRYFLKTEGIESPKTKQFLEDNNYKNIEEFFRDSAIGVELYERNTEFPNPSETLAQIFWLQAEYGRESGTYTEEKIIELENKGKEKFEEAIRREIYKRVKDQRNEAVKQFNKDYLHQYIISQRKDIVDSLHSRIKMNSL